MFRASTVGEKLKLSAHALGRSVGEDWQPGRASLEWATGESINLSILAGQRVQFHYKVDGQTVEPYTAQLVTTAQHLGGVRWWWLCPFCRRRVAHLYMVGQVWRCRHCGRLTYATIQERRDLLGTIDVRLGQLQRRLKGSGNFLTLPAKPKWMRWHTYERLAGEYRELLRLRDQAWMIDVLAAFGDTYLADVMPRNVNLDLAAKDTEEEYNEVRRKYRKHNFRKD